MKIRNGFVSNSSSSSFVVLGYKIETSKFDKEKYLKNAKIDFNENNVDEIDDTFYETLYEDEHIISDGEGGYLYIGKVLAETGSDVGFEDIEIDVSDDKALKEIKAIGKEYGVSKNPIKIYVGTIAC